MARIWQEGFEDGLPHVGYLEGQPSSEFWNGFKFSSYVNGIFPYYSLLVAGRTIASNASLKIVTGTQVSTLTKTLETSKSEVYLRVYYKHDKSNVGVNGDMQETILLRDTSGNKLISIYNTNLTGVDDWAIYAKTSGTYSKIKDITLSANTWYKIEIYFKVSASVGAWEVKVNDVSQASSSGDNTGSLDIKSIVLGNYAPTTVSNEHNFFDDIALNDTSGSINNSWCGSGTIVSLKPKGLGNKSQWDNSKGYAKGESGTTTTNIKITGHGLSTNDVIYNKTRDAYRIITYVDADNFTVSSVTGQTTNDVILLYKNVATIAATSGTSTSLVVIAGHTMQSGDVIVNTSRSNAIRKVIYVNGNNVYNNFVTTENGTLGSTITSQASGDSIKTFAFTPYAISNHWEAVANQTDPSPKLSYISSTTLNDIDTYDMQELTADKSVPAGASIVAVSHNIYAQEAGAGSEMQPMFRISSTDYAGTTISLSGGTLQYQQIYETSPDTSSAWTRSEIDGLEAGVKIV